MKILLWTMIVALMASGQMVMAHGGGGGGSHGGGGGGGSSHGGFHGGTFSHGGVGGGFHHGGGYGWWPWVGGWGWNGGWYDGLDYVPPTVAAPIVVTSAPEVGQQISVDGVSSYTSNGVMYVQTANGSFQPVYAPQVTVGNNSAAAGQPPATGSVPIPNSPPPPAVAVPAQQPAAGQPVENAPDSQGNTTQADEVFTVYIAKSKGGYAPITMRRSGTGYIGPQGEYYPEFPKIDLLKAMYGK
jgi:hypothetical protein